MRGLGIVSTFILVRLLSPEDFGLNAIAMSIFGFVDILSRFGFDTVLIQKQDADRSHYDTAWTLNVLFGVFACLFLLLSASLISGFYDNEKLKYVLYVVSLLFVMNGLLNVGTVDFRKNLTLDKEFKLQIIPKILSFVITISIAFWLKNYWALVIGTFVWKTFNCYFSYAMHEFRPRFSLSAWKELFHFSKWLMFGNVIRFFNRKSPELIIGKMISTQAAGYVSIGTEISAFATSELVANVNRAAYPGYSKVSTDFDMLKKTYLNVMASISFWVLPAGVGLSSLASVFVPVVLGPQWSETTALIVYLAIGSLIFSMNSNTVYVFLALGRPSISSYIALARLVVFIPTLWLLISLRGIIGAAQAVCLTSFVTFAIYNFVIVIILKFKIHEIVKIHFRPLISSIIMASGLYLFKYYFNVHDSINIFTLIYCISIGVFLYSISVLSLWSICGFPNGPERSILEIVKNKLTAFIRRI